MIAAAVLAARPATDPGSQAGPPALAYALAYADRGWPVFPCKPREKRPLISDWPHQASTDPATIRAWWQRYPHANVAIVPPAGLVVIDIDAKAGGLAWLAGDGAALCPPTLTSETGGGGLHLLYSVPPDAPIRQSAGEIAPGVDVRAAGRGYIIAPPSLHPSGARYHWRADAGPDATELTRAPWPLVQLLTAAPAPAPVAAPEAPQRALETPARPAPETLVRWGLSKITTYGGRDNACFKLARQVLANGYTGGDGERIILDYWAGCPQYGDDPFTQRDALKCWRSAHNYPTLAPWAAGADRPAVDDPTPAPPLTADGVIADVDPAAILPNLLAELAALRLALEEERSARQAAEARAAEADARARFVREWLKIPNVLPGVKTTAPFVAWQYQQKVSAGDVDGDGWIHFSPYAAADAQLPPEAARPEKVMKERAERIGEYVKDMAGLDWIEYRYGDYTHINGHIARPLYIRPKHDAFLTTPAALPFPTERKARPVKATCPKCQSSKTRRLVLCQCVDCGNVFAPPPDETTEDAGDVPPEVLAAAASAIETIPPTRRSQEEVTSAIKAWTPPKTTPAPAPVDPEKPDQETVGAYRSGKTGSTAPARPVDHIGGIASATAGAPSLRVAADAARELQARSAAPTVDPEFPDQPAPLADDSPWAEGTPPLPPPPARAGVAR